MSEFVGVVTTIGQQKIAAAIGGAALNLTAIRVGDGNGAPIVPVPGMTDLVRRVGAAYPIISSGRDPVNLTHWRVTALIPAADGPFDIREIGVFDAAGDMIAIARHVLVEKRSPAQGAAVELTTDIVFPVSETAQVTVQIQPSAAVSILQMLRAGFCSVESAQVANPPANPALGVTYVVAAGATGAWVGLTNRLVQWNGTVWVSIAPPQGFLVIAQDRALDHSDRWLRRIAGGWASARAAEDALGVVELATVAEVQAGVDVNRVITPAGLAARVATESATGIARLASLAETVAGVAADRVVTPAGLQAARLSLSRVRFTTPGAISWNVPAGINRIRVKAWGGAGGGGFGMAGSPAGAAAGGGAGAYIEHTFAVTPGQVITGTVGIGGAAGVSGANGGSGTASTITVSGVTMSAGAGAGGTNAAAGTGTNSAAGGQPGGNPDIGMVGQASNASFYGGGFWYGGSGGSAPAGGGYGGNAGTGPANNGLVPGGGGGGSGADYTAGTGGRGEIWIEY